MKINAEAAKIPRDIVTKTTTVGGVVGGSSLEQALAMNGATAEATTLTGVQKKAINNLSNEMASYDEKGVRAHNNVSKAANNAHGNTQKLGRAVDDLGSKWGGLLAQGAGIGIFAGAALGVMEITKATSAAQTSLADLSVAFKNTGSSLPTSQLSALQDHMALFGHTEDDANEALANLTTTSGSAKSALADMTAVADLAAHKHESLTDAAKQFTLATEGNAKALKDLGIQAALPLPSLSQMQSQNNAVAKAQDALNKALAAHAPNADKVTAANLRVTNAEARYQETLTKYGPGSIQVTNAENALTTARDRAGKAAGTSSTAVADASKKLADAQSKLADMTSRVNDPMKQQGSISSELEKKLHGVADAQSHSVGGAMATMGAEFNNISAQVGQQLIPVIQNLATWFSNNADTIKNVLSGALTGVITVFGTLFSIIGWIINSPLAPVIMGVVAALIAYKTYTTAASIATGIFEAVMDADPMMLIAIAIGALVGAFVLLITHLKQVGDFFATTWKGAQIVFNAFVDFVKTNWPIMLGVLTGGIGLLVVAVVSHFQQIKDFIGGIINDIVGFFHGMSDTVGRIVKGIGDGVSAVFQGIVTTVTSLFKGIGNFLLQPIDAVIGLINGAIDAINGIQIHFGGGPGGIGKFDFNGLGLGHIPVPHLAQGGIVSATSGGTLALLGEAGHDEAIIPLPISNSGATSTTVHIDLRGSQMMSDQSMDLLIRKIGDQFVQRHLTNAGVNVSRG